MSIITYSILCCIVICIMILDLNFKICHRVQSPLKCCHINNYNKYQKVLNTGQDRHKVYVYTMRNELTTINNDIRSNQPNILNKLIIEG